MTKESSFTLTRLQPMIIHQSIKHQSLSSNYIHTSIIWPSGLCPGLPGWAGTRTNLGFTEARDSEWQWHQLGYMKICTSIQTDNHDSIHHSVYYRQDALPAAQPTASKHW